MLAENNTFSPHYWVRLAQFFFVLSGRLDGSTALEILENASLMIVFALSIVLEFSTSFSAQYPVLSARLKHLIGLRFTSYRNYFWLCEMVSQVAHTFLYSALILHQNLPTAMLFVLLHSFTVPVLIRFSLLDIYLR